MGQAAGELGLVQALAVLGAGLRVVGDAAPHPQLGRPGLPIDHQSADGDIEDRLPGGNEADRPGIDAARRVFLETPVGGRGQDVARRAAFERFTSSELYILAPGFKFERTDLFEARPRLRADEQSLFQLYMAAVPAPVRAAEAMTLEEWGALYPGRKRWQPSS